VTNYSVRKLLKKPLHQIDFEWQLVNLAPQAVSPKLSWDAATRHSEIFWITLIRGWSKTFSYPQCQMALGPCWFLFQWVLAAVAMWVKQPGCEADHLPPFLAKVRAMSLLLHLSSLENETANTVGGKGCQHLRISHMLMIVRTSLIQYWCQCLFLL
jgi:hypothetical protein